MCQKQKAEVNPSLQKKQNQNNKHSIKVSTTNFLLLNPIAKENTTEMIDWAPTW